MPSSLILRDNSGIHSSGKVAESGLTFDRVTLCRTSDLQLLLNYKYQVNQKDDEIRKQAEAQFKDELKGQEEVNQMLTSLRAMVGQPAPALPTSGWIGKTRPEIAGKPYLIHFWATWCEPCKGNLPQLMQLAKAGCTVIGMHPPGTQPDEVAKFIEANKLGYSTLLEVNDNQIPKAPKIGGYPVGAFPNCVVVDGNGRVAGHGILSDMAPILERQTRLLEIWQKTAPALAAKGWLEPAEPVSNDKLNGKIVLLDLVAEGDLLELF